MSYDRLVHCLKAPSYTELHDLVFKHWQRKL